MSNFETNKIYLDSLAEAQKYHPDSLGLTAYEGAQQSDKIYPKMLNTQTILLIKLFNKIEELELKLSLLTNDSTTQIDLLNQLNSSKAIIPYSPRKTSYRSW